VEANKLSRKFPNLLPEDLPKTIQKSRLFYDDGKWQELMPTSINNCEHFANYVLHGINLSSQQHTWWKCLSADIISLLQPAQSISENYNSFMSQQIAEVLNESLRQAKIDQANQNRIEFWKNR
jgi:hypothetical protein